MTIITAGNLLKTINMPSNITNNKTLITTGVQSFYKNVKAKDILIDDSIQRKPNVRNIKRIIENYDSTKAKTIICMTDDTDELYVLDGQHTLLAILSIDNNAKITVQVHKFPGVLTVKQRTVIGSSLFNSYNNGIKTPVNNFYKLRAAAVSGDLRAINIFKVCSSHNVILTPGKAIKPLELSHIAHLEKSYDNYGLANLDLALKLLTTVYPKDIIDGSMLKAMCKFFFVYGSGFFDSIEKALKNENFPTASKNKNKTGLHDYSNEDDIQYKYMNFWKNNNLSLPKSNNYDLKHSWTFAYIVKNNNIDIDLLKLV